MASVTQEAEQCEEGDDDVFYVTNGRTNTNHSNTNGAGERVKTIDRYGFIIGANISSATPTTYVIWKLPNVLCRLWNRNRS